MATSCTAHPDSTARTLEDPSTVPSTQTGGISPPQSAAPHANRRDEQPPHLVATPQEWRLPAPLARAAVASAATGVIVAGGLVQGDVSTGDAYRLRLTDGQVTKLSSLVVPVHDAAGASPAGTPTVVGGGNSTEQAAVQALRPGGRWQVASSLPSARADLVAAVVRQRFVVLGGYDGTHEAAPILLSRGGHPFRVIGRLAVPVRYPAVVVWRGDIWLLGGERNGHMVAAVQRVDVPSGRCRVVGRLPQRLGHAAAAVVAGRFLVMGGRTSADSVTAVMVWFAPHDDSNRPAGRLPYPLADAGVATTRDGVYLLGGETPQLTDRVVRVSLR